MRYLWPGRSLLLSRLYVSKLNFVYIYQGERRHLTAASPKLRSIGLNTRWFWSSESSVFKCLGSWSFVHMCLVQPAASVFLSLKIILGSKRVAELSSYQDLCLRKPLLCMMTGTPGARKPLFSLLLLPTQPFLTH